MDRPAVRRHRFAFVFIALLVSVLFLPSLVKREVFTLRDHSDYFQPLRYLTALHIKALVLPYWNPYSASGESWVANPQTGVFYPPTWLFIPLPFETAYMIYLALHLVILGWGAYLLFARGVSEGAALVGAVAVMFSGPVLSLLDVSNNLATFAWVPLVMWAAVARASPALAALFLALAFLGGEPFFAALAALLYVVLRFIHLPAASRPPRFLTHAARDVAVAGFGALGLAAIQLLPFLEMIVGSDRAARLRPEEIFRESMPFRDWLRLAVPPRLTETGLDPALSQHFIPMVYAGAVVVILAAAGIVAGVRAGRARAVGGWVALLVVTILIAAGSALPFSAIVERLPVTPFRYPSRVVPFGALAIVGLAVFGWDRLRPQRRWADLVLILILLADLLPRAAPLLATAPFRPDAGEYPASAGRLAKILRVHDGPLIDRAAWMAGYVNLYHRRFDSSTAAPLAAKRYATLHDTAVSGGRLDLIGFMSAGFVLSDQPATGPLQPVAHVRGVTMYIHPVATRMATFWTRWQPAAGPDEALEMLIADGTTKGLPVAGAPPPGLPQTAARVVAAESLEIDTRRARVVVDAPEGGILMLTQQDAPAWRVFVGGKEAKKLLAGGVFRAVALPRGRHDVEWRWDPSLLRVGTVITLISMFTLQTMPFVKRWRRRKFSSRLLKSQV